MLKTVFRMSIFEGGDAGALPGHILKITKVTIPDIIHIRVLIISAVRIKYLLLLIQSGDDLRNAIWNIIQHTFPLPQDCYY